MKKLYLISAAAVLALALTACGSGGAANKAAASNAGTVAAVLENAAAEAEETPAVAAEDTSAGSDVLDGPEALASLDLSSADADVDLTTLSSTMVYSVVSQMVYSPEEFLGQTVKMRGTFAIYEGEARNYYACLVSDATACCANGIEFERAGEHSYPEDYPEPGEEITVVGTFETYEEDGFTYIQLGDAEMTA